MHLTRHTDYALRVLIHLAAHPQQFAAASDIAAAYGISQNHLMKVVQALAAQGYLTTQRGRHGGVALAQAAADINIGAVIRAMEPGFDLADCAGCVIAPACGLVPVLSEAVRAFLAVFDRYTLADVSGKRRALIGLLGL